VKAKRIASSAYQNPQLQRHHQPPRNIWFRENTLQHIAFDITDTTRLTLARIKTTTKPTSDMPPKRAAAATKAAAKDAPTAAAKNKANTA
jgi:hypothetical protein